MSAGGAPGEGGDDQPIDLNLTALMDILSNILFFLLASFGAAVISVVSASVPVSSIDESDGAKTDDAVTMTVAINAVGYRVTASSETLSPEQLEGIKLTLPRTAKPPKDPPKGSKLNELDFPKLTEALFRVKRAYPKSESVIIVPEPTILYDEVVQTMDACREKQEKDGMKVTKTVLFGKVVVSTTIQ